MVKARDSAITGKDPGNYPNLFRHAETEAGEEDYLRAIAALKVLSEESDPAWKTLKK